MRLLAIETATEACSVALWVDGDVRERHEVAPRMHAELVLADTRSLLADSGLRLEDLDGIAMGRGPGSFTGVRIAASMVQGLALGSGLPVAPVSTLAALAAGAMRVHAVERVIAALDARMGEVYLARFTMGESGMPEAAGREVVVPPGEAPVPDAGGWFGAGPGFRAQDGALQHRLSGVLSGTDPDLLPRARDVAALGAGLLARDEGVPPEQALPVYVRENVARKQNGSKEQGARSKGGPAS